MILVFCYVLLIVIGCMWVFCITDISYIIKHSKKEDKKHEK